MIIFLIIDSVVSNMLKLDKFKKIKNIRIIFMSSILWEWLNRVDLLQTNLEN